MPHNNLIKRHYACIIRWSRQGNHICMEQDKKIKWKESKISTPILFCHHHTINSTHTLNGNYVRNRERETERDRKWARKIDISREICTHIVWQATKYKQNFVSKTVISFGRPKEQPQHLPKLLLLDVKVSLSHTHTAANSANIEKMGK